MSKRFTLWDPNIGNVALGEGIYQTLVAGTGISIEIDSNTGLVTIIAQDQVDDFASPPPLGDVEPNTVAATTLSAENTTTLGGLTLAELGLTVSGGETTLTTTQVTGLTSTALATFSAGITVLTTTQIAGLNATGLATLSGGLTVTGNVSINTTTIGGLTATKLTSLASTQIGGLSVATFSSAVTGTITANGTTGITSTIGGLTANSIIAFTLKTVGGTVGIPYVATITPPTSFVMKSQASDTSTYNFAVLG